MFLFKQQSLVDRYLKQKTLYLSSFSFVNVFLWQDFFDFELEVENNNLLVWAKNPLGLFLYWPPLGEVIVKETVDYCFEKMQRVNKNSAASRIENLPVRCSRLFCEQQFSFFKKADEYCYRRDHIAQLQGNRYKSKRSSFNFFLKNYSHKILAYQPSLKEECLNLFDRWAKIKWNAYADEIYRQMLTDSRSVHDQALTYSQELDLKGIVIVVNNQIVGYTLGYEINPSMFCVLLEVTDHEFKGISEFIFSSLAQDERLKSYRFLNVMDDFGMPNVGQVKRSYHPCFSLGSFSVSLKA